MIMNNQRKAFSMLTALVVIVLMSTVTFLVLNTSGKIVKETTSQYRNEQSRLLAKSYTELAILSVMGHNRAADCVSLVQGTINTLTIGAANPVGGNAANGGYTVQTDIQYLGNGFPAHASCTMLNAAAIISPRGPNLLIDVYVRYSEPDNPALNITYHRRTLQKL